MMDCQRNDDVFWLVDDVDLFSKSVDISKVLGIGKSSKHVLEELGVQTLLGVFAFERLWDV